MTKDIGDFGESAACNYLVRNGYAIIKRNFRLKCGEIDIIAKKDGTTVFVEVKTRRSTDFGRPSEFVDFRKQAKIRKTAMCFIKSLDTDMRFDVIEVLYKEIYGKFEITSINHIENAL